MLELFAVKSLYEEIMKMLSDCKNLKAVRWTNDWSEPANVQSNK